MVNEVSDSSLTAGLYVRVSTGRQEKEETIDSQLCEIEQRIALDGTYLPRENIFVDEGWTGEILQRPGLDAMRDAAQAGKFHVLYVYDRGRISRMFAHQEVVIEELLEREIKFVTLHDIQAETPEEQVLQAMQGVFQQYERVKIAERFRRGKLYKARQGLLINGQSLYGYNRVAKSADVNAHYEINNEERRAVVLIRKWFGEDGKSIYEIIKLLAEWGIPPRRGKSLFWTRGPLLRLLKCDTYHTGVVYFNKTEAIVAKNPRNKSKYRKVKRTSRRARPREEWIPINVIPLVPDDGLFEKIQKILADDKRYAPKNRKYNYLLTGKVFCGCGNRRAGDGYKNNHYYRCAERIYKYPVEKKCKLPGINAPELDKSLWDKLSRILTNPKSLRDQAKVWLESRNEKDTHTSQEIQRVNIALEKLAEEERRYIKAYGVGAMEFETLQALTKDLKRRKDSYGVELVSLESKKEEETDPILLTELYQEACTVLKSLHIGDKVRIVRELIDKVVVEENNLVKVWAHIPLSTEKVAYKNGDRDRRIAKRREVLAF